MYLENICRLLEFDLDLGDNADSESVVDLGWIWMTRLFSERLLISWVGF